MKLGVGQRALAIAAFGLFTTASAIPAAADTATEIRELKERLKQLEAMVAKQNVAVKRATNVANAAQAHVSKDGHGHRPPPPVFVSFRNGLFVETEDKAYSFKVGGRVQVDGGGINTPIGLAPNYGYKGQAGIRRARLEVEGVAAKIWFYKLQYDFAGSGLAGIRDAYIGLKVPNSELPYATSPVWIHVGSTYEPFSLDAMNSSKYIDFIERPMSVPGFAPFRHIGVSAASHGDNWTARAGVFTASFEDANFAPTLISAPATFWAPVPRGGGQYFDVTGRLTYAPIKTEHEVLHLGVAGRYHQPNDATGASDDRMLRVGNRERSEANILGMQTLGTPDLSCGSSGFPLGGIPGNAVFSNTANVGGVPGKCVNNEVQYGFELAAAWGPLSFQGEYIGMQVNRNPSKMLQSAILGNFTPGGSSAYFNGFYGYGQWYITGEERAEAYSVKDKNGASFEQIKILHPFSKGGPGAISVAARYSAMNLNSGRWSGSGLYNMLTFSQFVLQNNNATAVIANQAGIAGGRQENTTLGINWYPDNGFHFQANWTHVLHWSAPLQGPSALGYSAAGLVPSPLLALQGRYQSQSHPDLFEVRAQVYW
ncbi:OprO/OprP family phosphate-selective porin [Methylocystis sp.]|uniref:OprO/OprP family phosphate-selective porin n=1 Tax=Methylocystis sp. TaxID=1911079 RepID=UPI003D09648F